MSKCIECSFYNICKNWEEDAESTSFPYEYSGDTKPCKFFSTDNTFIQSVTEKDNYIDVLNWYRRLHHSESINTERGFMAKAIHDLFSDLKNSKAEKVFDEEIKRHN